VYTVSAQRAGGFCSLRRSAHLTRYSRARRMSTSIPIAALSDMEAQLLRLLHALQAAQAHHQFHDPQAPTFNMPAELLQDKAAFEKAKADYRAAHDAYMAQRARPEPRQALPLALLWDAVVSDEHRMHYYDVPKLEPARRDHEDLYFDSIAISQRRVNEKRSPHGWLPRSYYLAVPIGDEPFRCIVHEVSCRTFCTPAPTRNCVVPKPDDFGVVRVSGTGVNYRTGERGPTVMHLYLPTQYGEWCIVVGHYGESADERVIGYEDG
jgi:hypothetical protein